MGNRGKMGKKDKTLEKEENRVRGGKCRKNGKNEEILRLVEQLAWIKAV